MVGTGDNVFSTDDMTGVARFISTVERVMEMLVEGVPEHTIAVIDDSGGTLTAPILADFAGVICLGGTVRAQKSHAEVDPDDDPASVHPVRGSSGHEPEEQRRQHLGEQRHRDEQRIPGLGRHEQRAGGKGNPVAGVADDGR